MSKDYDEITINIVNQLFENLFSVCKAWKVALGDEQAVGDCKRQWLSTFKENNITSIERIKKGMVKVRARKLPFLPSPGEFLEMCTPCYVDEGWPEPKDAFGSACRVMYDLHHNVKSPIHPGVDAARKATGASIFARGDKYSEPVFIRNYEIIFKRFVDGESLDTIDPPKALNTPSQEPKFNPNYQGYAWARPGVMKAYDGITREEALDVIGGLLKGATRFKGLNETIKSF